jgi:hypothetical protein
MPPNVARCTHRSVQPCRRSRRVRGAVRNIEDGLVSLWEITQALNPTPNPNDYAVFFAQLWRCLTAALALVEQIRRMAKRVNIGVDNRELVELHCTEAEGVVHFARQEIESVTAIIEQAGTFTAPAEVPPGTPACCVCQEDCEAFGATGRVVLRHCGVPGARHALCGGCFMAWFIQRGESTCPVCRANYDAHFKSI